MPWYCGPVVPKALCGSQQPNHQVSHSLFPDTFFAIAKILHYEVPIDFNFVKSEDMTTIPKPPHVTLPSNEIVKLHDHRKKCLKAVRSSCHGKQWNYKAQTLQRCPLPCTQWSPLKVQILNSPFFLVADIHLFPWQGKSFSKMAQSSQYKRSKRKTKCLWLRGKIFWTLKSPITADIFMQDRENSLHFSWSCNKPTASLWILVASCIKLHCSVEGAVGEGTTRSRKTSLRSFKLYGRT